MVALGWVLKSIRVVEVELLLDVEDVELEVLEVEILVLTEVDTELDVLLVDVEVV